MTGNVSFSVLGFSLLKGNVQRAFLCVRPRAHALRSEKLFRSQVEQEILLRIRRYMNLLVSTVAYFFISETSPLSSPDQ